MVLNDLITLVRQRTDENTAWWPDTTIVTGCNLAQNLCCLMNPDLIVERTAVDVAAETAYLSLSQVAPRALGLRRVVLGNVSTDHARLTTGRGEDLEETTLGSLRGRNAWMQHTGTPRQWYRYTRTLIGLYRRPQQACTMTLIHSSIPPAFEATNIEAPLVIDVSYQPLVAQVAVCLLRWREGTVESQLAINELSQLFQTDTFSVTQKVLATLRRSTSPEQSSGNVGNAYRPSAAAVA